MEELIEAWVKAYPERARVLGMKIVGNLHQPSAVKGLGPGEDAIVDWASANRAAATALFMRIAKVMMA